MPVACLFILSLPQKVQVYFECCEISIFLTVFLREAPYLGFPNDFSIYSMCSRFSYLVPYFPVIPTFLVRLAILKAASAKDS